MNKKNSTTLKHLKVQKFFTVIMAILVMQFVVSCSTANRQLLDEAEQLLEHKADSALLLLECIDQPQRMSRSDYMRWCLLAEQARTQCNRPTSPDSLMSLIISYYKQTNDRQRLGEAYYTQGVEWGKQHQPRLALNALREAENCFLPTATDAQMGKLYYHMGCFAEEEESAVVCADYYERALPYLQRCDDKALLALNYRNLAHCYEYTQPDKARYYYQQAELNALKTNDLMLKKTLRTLIQRDSPLWEPHDAIATYGYLCDTLHLKRFAAEVAYSHWQLGNQKACAHYLDILETDTANSPQNKQQLHYIKSLYYQSNRLNNKALEELRLAYDLQRNMVDVKKQIRKLAIERHYDLTLQKEKNMHLQQAAYERSLHFWVVLSALALFVLLALLMITYQKKQNALHVQIINQQRAALNEQLRLRIRNTQQLNRDEHAGKYKLADLPPNIRAMVNDITYVGDKSDLLFDEFKTLYSDFIKTLKTNYLKLTDKDLLLACLLGLGFDNADIIALLWINPVSFYRRRQLLKRRLGLGDDGVSLDEFCRSALAQSLA